MPLPGLERARGLDLEAGRRVAPGAELVGQRHAEAGGVGGGDQLLGAGLAAGLLGAGRPGDAGVAEQPGRDRRHGAAALEQIALPDGTRSTVGHGRLLDVVVATDPMRGSST